MRKVAVFVEGQTELILVRELILKIHNYQDISLECFTLFQDNSLKPTEYEFIVEEAENYFQILNVGNDKSVLSRMLKREASLLEAGFDSVIGIRDMYSKEYKDEIKNQTIDWTVINRFRSGYASQIRNAFMHICFAIMEVEAWLIGLYHIFQKMDPTLNRQYIKTMTGYDLEDLDPETTFFHPSNYITNLFALTDSLSYSKSKSDVYSIVAHIDREDYLTLLSSGKCESFKDFYNLLIVA